MPGPLSDKTERLDDVIAKLRAQPAVEPVSAAPPSPPVRRPETASEPSRATESAPATPPSPAGRRLVVYGELPPPFVKAPPRASPPHPAPPAVALAAAPAPDATGRRIRLIVVGLIVAAIVILFAVILWVLVSLVRSGAPGETPRTSRGGSSGAVAEAAHGSVDPKSE